MKFRKNRIFRNFFETFLKEAQRIATNLTQAARQVVLNAVYNNENQVVFSLKLTDETAHGMICSNFNSKPSGVSFFRHLKARSMVLLISLKFDASYSCEMSQIRDPSKSQDPILWQIFNFRRLSAPTQSCVDSEPYIFVYPL